MDTVRQTAFCLTLWYALLTGLVTALGITLHDFDAATALLAAANVSLLFALVLMARAGRLTERSVVRGAFWRTLPPKSRPAGEAGARLAQSTLRETWLTFARGATVLAVALAGLAYVSHTSPQALTGALKATAAHAAASNTWADYRVARLPTN